MRDEDFFWAGVDEGKLLAQQCAECGTLRHPPAPMCGNCQSLKWDAQELSGRGTVFSWLISKHPTLADAAPRTVLLIDLDEGLRLVSNLSGGGSAAIGDPVVVCYEDVNGTRLPQFRKAAVAA
jgi:hypothetical protein